MMVESVVRMLAMSPSSSDAVDAVDADDDTVSEADPKIMLRYVEIVESLRMAPFSFQELMMLRKDLISLLSDDTHEYQE